MFISNAEKEDIQTSIKILKVQVSHLLEEVNQLRARKVGKPAKAKKEPSPEKEEAAKLRRREYAKLYARRKKEESLKASLSKAMESAPQITMQP